MLTTPFYRRREFGSAVLLAVAADIYLALYNPLPPLSLSSFGLDLAVTAGVILGTGMLVSYGHPRRGDMRGLIVLAGVTLACISIFTQVPEQHRPSILLDLAIGGLSFAMGLALVSQFVLPVTRLAQRKKALDRLVTYMLGGHGPVVFVHNGKMVAHEDETDRAHRGPGVMLIDWVSGAVLESDTAFKRAVGPGVVFTEADEHIADTLDLRKQRRAADPPKVIPADTNGTPGKSGAKPAVGAAGSAKTTTAGPAEVEKADITRQALTRDGIEVTATISVVFQLDPGVTSLARDSTKDAGASPPRFNPDSAFKAVYGEAVSERYNVRWSDLPLLVAVDVWRELLLAVDVDQLFETDPQGALPVANLNAQLNLRLKGPGTREARVLKSRGILLLNASASGLALPSKMTERRIQNWQDGWKRRAEDAVAVRDPILRERKRAGHVAGHVEAARAITEDLRLALGRGETPSRRQSLLMLLDGALRLCQDPLLGFSTTRLRELRAWVEQLPGPDGR